MVHNSERQQTKSDSDCEIFHIVSSVLFQNLHKLWGKEKWDEERYLVLKTLCTRLGKDKPSLRLTVPAIFGSKREVLVRKRNEKNNN